MVMYLLKDVSGRGGRQPRAARHCCKHYAFKGPPYPTSRDLIERSAGGGGPGAPAADHRPVREDHALRPQGDRQREAPSGPTANGTSRSTSKLASSTRTEGGRDGGATRRGVRRGRLHERARQARLYRGGNSLARAAARDERQAHYTVVVDKEPRFVGLDPYNKYVDRNSDDNVRAVTVESRPADNP